MAAPVDVLAAHGYLPGLEPARQQHFIDACKEGLVDAVRAYLDLGMPIDVKRDISHEPALVAAAEGGSIPTVELLLDRGAALEQRDRSGDTAFRTALNWERFELARWLAARGADLDAPNEYGESTLDHAVREDKPEALALLLELGANPSFVSDHRGPLRSSLASGKLHAFEQLLEAGVSPHLVVDARHGVTALHEAVSQSNAEAIARLLERGADSTARDAYGLTPLDYALELEHARPELAELLGAPSAQQVTRARFWQQLRSGEPADALTTLERGDLAVDTRDREHGTALAAFARVGHVPGVQRLLERGAQTAPVGTESAVSAALGAGQVEVLAHLLAAGAPVASANGKVEGASNAVWEGHLEAMRRVLEVCTPAQRVALADRVASAVMQRNAAMVKLLADHGVPVDEPGFAGDRPLADAMGSYFSQEVIDVLLAAGADVRATDKGGDTPLHELLSSYQWDETRVPVMRELLARGAPLDALNWQRRPPYDVAVDEAKPALQQAVADDVSAAGTPAGEVAKTASWATVQIFYKAGHRDFTLALVAAGALARSSADGIGLLFEDVVEAQDLELARALVAAGADVSHTSSYGTTLLASAAGTGNLELAGLLLEAGARLDGHDDYGWPISSCARSPEMRELFARHGARFDQRVCSPLYPSLSDGDEAGVDWLLARGAYPDAVVPSGATMLAVAIERGDPALVEKLLAAGASPSLRIRSTGDTPVTAATKHGQVAIVQALLAAGAQPTDTDGDGATALALMTQRKQLRLAFAELLLAHGVDVTVPKVEPLPVELRTVSPVWAAVYGRDRAAIGRALDDGSLGANDRDAWGVTPLMAATQLRDEETVRALLARGADHTLEDPAKARAWDYGGLFSRSEEIDEQLKAAGEAISMDRLNAQAARSLVFDDVKSLIDRGELGKLATMIRERRVHPLLALGARSLVHEAVRRDDEDLLGVLIDLGLPLDQDDAEGVSPIALALSQDRVALAEQLVAGGANAAAPGVLQATIAGHSSDESVAWLLERTPDLRRADRHGHLAIHGAAMLDRPSIIELLLERDPTLRDVAGRDDEPPLHTAAASGAVQAATLLLERGADPEATDATGASPLAVAIRQYDQAMAALLVRHGADVDAVPPRGRGDAPRALLAEMGLDAAWLEGTDDVQHQADDADESDEADDDDDEDVTDELSDEELN